mmetsp:Transcript_56813/g.65094  ORF Transcript_56813/g.65094 Transcript_56813/m.65094 type:complete len:139 (+) Transcript_56813:44-460(+)
MANFVKFPKNLNAIKKAADFKNYCLKPKGLDVLKTTSHFKKQQEVIKYLNIPLTLYRGEKPMDEKTVAFKCDQKLTKPELRQYLEKVYGLEVEKVNTLNYMGKVKRAPLGGFTRNKDFKKAYAILKTNIDPFYQKTFQ